MIIDGGICTAGSHLVPEELPAKLDLGKFRPEVLWRWQLPIFLEGF